MKKLFAVVFLTIFTLMIFLPTQKAKALTCLPFESYTKALNDSELVFQGKVDSERVESDGKSFTFVFSKVWKGDMNSKVTLYQTETDITWSYTFEKGKEYIVFATVNEKGYLNLPLCGTFVDSANDTNLEVAKIYKELGEGKIIKQEPNSPIKPINNDSIIIAGSLVLTLITLISTYLLYKNIRK